MTGALAAVSNRLERTREHYRVIVTWMSVTVYGFWIDEWVYLTI
jgi:hypothetical protein